MKLNFDDKWVGMIGVEFKDITNYVKDEYLNDTYNAENIKNKFSIGYEDDENKKPSVISFEEDGLIIIGYNKEYFVDKNGNDINEFIFNIYFSKTFIPHGEYGYEYTVDFNLVYYVMKLIKEIFCE